ncbi:MAG: cytochrome c peroxidase [Myxococcota bacterium]
MNTKLGSTFGLIFGLVHSWVLLAGCGGGSPGGLGEDPTDPGTTSGAEEPELATESSGLVPEGESSGELESDESSGGSPSEPTEPEPEPWVWTLPSWFPEPYVPEDNPMSVSKVALGRHLFYDERLSGDQTVSCATCHRQELAFTDGLAQAEGVTGQVHPRGSMALANVAYAATLAWADPTLVDLEEHALGPMFAQEPIVEMGLKSAEQLLDRLRDEPRYTELFAAAYPGQADPVTLDNVTRALATFQRSLISANSPFDRWFYGGDEEAMSPAAKRGWELFTFRGECHYCHFGLNLSDSLYFPGMSVPGMSVPGMSLPGMSVPGMSVPGMSDRHPVFHNTALYNEDGEGAYPPGNEGLYAFTGQPEDMGKFKSPTLRNIVQTAPYMHDGSIDTLEEVIDHYAEGGACGPPAR